VSAPVCSCIASMMGSCRCCLPIPEARSSRTRTKALDDSEGRDRTGRGIIRSGQTRVSGGTGVTPTGRFIALNPIRQKGGKIVHAWAFEGDCDPMAIVSNTFSMEWPPKSGRQVAFPEMDRADFFGVTAAKEKIKASQRPLIDELETIASGER